LTRIVHNLAVDAVRVRRPTPLDPQELLPLMAAMTEPLDHQVLGRETSTQLRSALATLPAEQARAVVMAAVHGLTTREIADAENIPVGTAKSRLRAGMAKLHAVLPIPRAGDE
jgi:RNA polymerase sigma factor (sigma-70 family)